MLNCNPPPLLRACRFYKGAGMGLGFPATWLPAFQPVDSAEPLVDQWPTRTGWMQTQMAPFSSNMAFVIYRAKGAAANATGSSHLVRMMYNEQVTKAGGQLTPGPHDVQ